MITIKATLHSRPNNQTKEITVTNIETPDADWLNEHDVRVSMEDIGGNYAVYFDDGCTQYDDPLGDPDELLILANGRRAELVFAEAVGALKQRMSRRKEMPSQFFVLKPLLNPL